jgi:hypothetical protein
MNMSGGHFDYLCYRTDKITSTLNEMYEWCETHDHPEAAAHVKDLAEEIERSNDLFKAIEWVASGDYGPEKIDDELVKLP